MTLGSQYFHAEIFQFLFNNKFIFKLCLNIEFLLNFKRQYVIICKFFNKTLTFNVTIYILLHKVFCINFLFLIFPIY